MSNICLLQKKYGSDYTLPLLATLENHHGSNHWRGSQQWILIVFCIEQVFGGRVQENPLFPVAREPDRIQSGLLILCYMENHAKLQVKRHYADR